MIIIQGHRKPTTQPRMTHNVNLLFLDQKKVEKTNELKFFSCVFHIKVKQHMRLKIVDDEN